MNWRTYSTGRLYDANEDTVVYFDSHSGDTHLLSDFAGYIMQKLNTQPMTTEELVSQLSPSFDAEDDSDVSEAVIGVLEELVALDILTRG
jgi:PqqD family protein of HPr-rel-A system